ncbi:MAG: hypothetical protein M3405_13855 [Acidobacteriota bacterium]|jgi:hypothetical protein|nr:hypothetical protein [Acidobacteriota bacterium]
MINKNYGTQVVDIWEGMRPMTKKMLVGAMKTNNFANKQKITYDAHADWELSRLLTALDEQAKDKKSKTLENLSEINQLAEVCANVLESQTETAEVFIQLAKRVLARNDYHKFDHLGDVLFDRFSAGEIAEIIRQTDLAQIRAICFETLAILPVTLIVPLLDDPLYFEIGCMVLEQQAIEFENEEASDILEQIDFIYMSDN